MTAVFATVLTPRIGLLLLVGFRRCHSGSPCDRNEDQDTPPTTGAVELETDGPNLSDLLILSSILRVVDAGELPVG